MFTEILRIKPVIDPSTAKRMDTDLNTRFNKISKKFGFGLKSIIKGTFLGISVGLLARLLNPLEAVEDRIKALLKEGDDINEVAKRLGTSSGSLKIVQDVARSQGLQPDKFTEIISKFADSVEQAREEIKDPTKEKSGATQVLLSTIGKSGIENKNILDSFLQFKSGLIAEGKGQGRIVNATGVPIKRTGEESRQFFEKEVLGHTQFGAGRDFLNTNVAKEAARLNLPSANRLTQALSIATDASKFQRGIEVQNENRNLLKDTGVRSGIFGTIGPLSAENIQALEGRKQRQSERLSANLHNSESLHKGQAAVDDIKANFETLQRGLTEGLGHLDTITRFIDKISISRWWTGSGGKRENQ